MPDKTPLQLLLDKTNKARAEGTIGVNPSDITNYAIPSYQYKDMDKYGVDITPTKDLNQLQEERGANAEQMDSWFGRRATDVARFAGKTFYNTIGSLVQPFDMMAQIPDMNSVTDMSKLFNTSTQTLLDKKNEEWANNYQNYYSKQQENADWYTKWIPGATGSEKFWFGDMADGASFLASMALTELAYSGLTAVTLGGAGELQGLATAGLAAKAVRMLKNLDRAEDIASLSEKGLSLYQNALRVDKALKIARQTATGAMYEAGVESRQYLNETENKLKAMVESGELTSEEFQDAMKDATKTANMIFVGNSLLVGAGNVTQFKNIFGWGSKGLAELVSSKGVRESLKDLTVGSALKKGLTNAFTEANEEFQQAAFQNTGTDYVMSRYDRKNYDKAHNVLESAYNGYAKTLGDNEDMTGVLSGFFLGALGMPNVRGISNNIVNRNKEGYQKQDNWSGGLYGEIEQMRSDRAKLDTAAKEYESMNKEDVVNTLKTAISENTKKNINDGMTIDNAVENQHAAIASGDVFRANNEAHKALFTFVKNRVELGQDDDLHAMIDQVKGMSDEEFNKTFYDGKLDDRQIGKRKSEAVNSFKDVIEDTKKNLAIADEVASSPIIKDALAYNLSSQTNLAKRAVDMYNRLKPDTFTTFEELQKNWDKYANNSQTEKKNKLNEGLTKAQETLAKQKSDYVDFLQAENDSKDFTDKKYLKDAELKQAENNIKEWENKLSNQTKEVVDFLNEYKDSDSTSGEEIVKLKEQIEEYKNTNPKQYQEDIKLFNDLEKVFNNRKTLVKEYNELLKGNVQKQLIDKTERIESNKPILDEEPIETEAEKINRETLEKNQKALDDAKKADELKAKDEELAKLEGEAKAKKEKEFKDKEETDRQESEKQKVEKEKKNKETREKLFNEMKADETFLNQVIALKEIDVKPNIELVEKINPEKYASLSFNEGTLFGNDYIQTLKYQALAKLSNQRNSPYYSVQSITTIDRTDGKGVLTDDEGYRINKEGKRITNETEIVWIDNYRTYLINKNAKQYELDLDTPINEDEFELVTANFVVDRDSKSDVGYNSRLKTVGGEKGTTIAVVRKGTNKIIGFINDRIFAYKDENGKMIPFLKPNTRELNPQFNLAWIGMKGKQVEIQDQLNLLSTLTSGSLVKTTEGKLRFPKDSATINLTEIEQLFENPKVASVSVFQRIYEGSDVLYQEWKYNRELKRWEAGNKSDQDRVDANTLAITYTDKHVSNISVNVSKENQEQNLSRAIEILEDKGSTTKSKVFFTINSDQISQVLLIERSVDNTKAVVKIISGTKGEKSTTSFEWGNWSEFDNLFNQMDGLDKKEALNLFKTFINAKLKTSSDKAQLPLVYKLYTVSFNDESFDREIAAGKYIIPKMEGKLSVVNVEKADIAVNEGTISKDDSFEEEVIENAPIAPKIPINTSNFETGQYVKYNDEVYIITKQNSNGTWQIYNPNLEGVNAKKSVSKDKLELVNGKAKIVTYRDADYIVTPKNTIISLTSNKKVFEDEKNGNRLAILDLANQEVSEFDNFTKTGKVLESIVDRMVEKTINGEQLTIEEVSYLTEKDVIQSYETKLKAKRSSSETSENPSIEDVSFEETNVEDIEKRRKAELWDKPIKSEGIKELANIYTGGGLYFPITAEGLEVADSLNANNITAEDIFKARKDLGGKFKDWFERGYIFLTGKTFQEKENEINAKYDAELAKLEKSETSLDEKIAAFEEKLIGKKEYSQLEINTALEKNEGDFVDMLRYASTQKGRGWAAIINALNDKVPKSQISNKKSEITHQKAVEIFKEYFPNTALSLEDVETVLGKLSFLPNSVVYGVYNGLVRLRQGGTLKDTPFFEGFRLVFNALITDKEKSQILEEARLKYFLGLPKGQKEIILKEFQRTYSPRLNNEYVWQGKELENYYLETMLAREFANKATTNKPKSFIQRLFDKIRSWLGINKIDTLFNRILDKEFKDFPYNPKDNQGTVKTMLDVYSSESETGKDLMTSENAYRIANRIFSKMARDKMSFEKALSATRQYYDDLADIAYNNAEKYEGKTDEYSKKKKVEFENIGFNLETLSNSMDNSSLGKANVEKLRKEVEDRKAILSFDPDAVNEEDNENKDIAIRDGENFSQSLRELGGEMSASKKFKEYLSTIMYVDDEFDLFGTAFSEEFKNMPETEQKKFYIPVDFISVYNTMLKLTAGKPKSEILGLNETGLLNLMKGTDKQLLAVVNQINIDIANPQEFDTTLDMILSNLEKNKVQSKIVLQDNETGKFDMSDENTQGIENSQINKWASEYEMRHVGKIEATKELKAVLDRPNSADEVYKALTKYGFKVSRLYCQWCYGLKTGKYENEIVPKIATEYGLTTNQSILDTTNTEYIFKKIITREEENVKLIASGLPGVETIFPTSDIYFGEKKNEGSRNKLKAVAFGNSIFDSSVKNLSYKNSENKTVYEIIARMQVGDFVNIINKIIKANSKGEPLYDAIRNKIIALNNDNDAIEALLKTEVNGKYPYLSFINSIYNLVQEGKDMENGEDMALKDVQDILIDLGKFIFHNNLENFIEKDINTGQYKQMEIGFLGGYRNTSGEMIGDTYVEDEKSKSKAGTTFSSANEQEKTLALLGVWLKGWYNPIVAAGKSMQFIFKGNKKTRLAEGRILNRTKDTLMNWFDQELHRIDRGIKGQLSKDIDKYEQKAQKFFENKAFVDSLANTSLKEIYSAFIEVDSKDTKLVAAKLQEKKDFIEKYKTDKQFRDDIREALFNFHNNLSINFANNTIGTVGINLPQVLIAKTGENLPKFAENDLNPGTENHRLMVNALQEFYFDDLINSTAFYNTFIGDKAMGLKNYIDVNKRAGKHIAGGVSSETADRNIVAIGINLDNDILGEKEEFEIDSIWYKARKGLYKLFGKKVDSVDAESYQTVRSNIDFYLKSNAKYTKEVHEIYDMISYGIEASFEWWERLDGNNAALQKRKMVYADFLQYVKTSVNTLTWQECSFWNSEALQAFANEAIRLNVEKLTPLQELAVIKTLTENNPANVAKFRTVLPSRKKMFGLLSFMLNNKIDYVYHDSASKSLQRRIKAKDFDKLEAKNAHYLNPTYWKEQVATDGVKMEVIHGTQLMQLVFSEQNGEIKVDIGRNTFNLDKVSDTYKQYLANRINMMYEKVLAELQNEDKTINIDELKAGFVKALEKSGSTQQTIKFFKESNINLPHIVEKAESMFMSRVSKVLSHKKSGSALALASPKLYPIMRATTKIELSNSRTISENEVISTETYKKFSSEFTEGKNFAISRLRHGIKEGEHYYAEIILPANHPALAYMKDGFIPAEFADMVGIRIPTQDKHSMTSMKVVDILPAYKGSTIVLPLEIILLSGADFDIDKEYIYWYAGYQTVTGWKKYGTYKDEKSAYFEWIKTTIGSDKELKQELYAELKNNIQKFIVDNKINISLEFPLFQTLSEELQERLGEILNEVREERSSLIDLFRGFNLGEEVSEKELDKVNKYMSQSIYEGIRKQAFANSKLPTTQLEWKNSEVGKKMIDRMNENITGKNKEGGMEKTQTNKYELDNDLLDLEKVMIHNNGNNDIAYTPSSMDIVNQAVQSHILLVDKERLRCAEFYGMELATFDALPSSEKVEKIQKFVKEKGYINVYGNHSPLDKLTAYYNNDVGSKNIGVWALSNVVMQTLIKESKHITIDNGAYMLHGIRINDIISSFLSSATDNDKEQHAAILQLDQETCGIMFDLMWRQGLHPTVALGIIYDGNGGNNKDLGALMQLNPNLSEEDANFLNNLMNNVDGAATKAENLLTSSKNAAKYTMALTTVMGLNKGFKSTISDNQTIVEAIKTLKKGVVDKETGMTLPKPYEGWDIVQSDPHLKEEVDKFEKVYDELTPKIFLVRNEKLRNTLEKMTASLKGMNYPTNRTKVYRDLISYVIVNIIKNNDDLIKNYSKIGGEEIFTTGLISKVKTILTPLVDNSLMKGLTAVKKIMKQGEFEGKTIDSVSMNTWLKAVRFVDEKMQNDYERFNRRPHALEEIKNAMEQSNTQGINIFTKSNDELGRALTNPNWGYKKDGKNYYDVETEYKANTSKIKRPDLSIPEALKYDMNLMYQLQVKKFQQNPELIDMINKRGGLQFILNSEHTVGVKNSRWEGKGSGSNFIKVLAKSYEKVAKDLNKFVEGKKSKSLDEILSNIDTNHLMGTLAKLMYIQSVVKEGLQFKSGSVNSLISTPLFAQTNGLIDRLMNEKNFEEITGKSADRLMIDFIRNFVADESNKSFLPSLYKQEYFMEANEQGDTIGNAREALKNAGFNFDEKKKVIPAFGISYGKVRLVLNETSIKAMLNDEEFIPIYESISTKGGKDIVGYRNDEIKPGEKIGNGMYYTGKKDAELEAILIKEALEKIKNQTLAEKIYVSLPKKTESGNVFLKKVYGQAGIDYAKSIGGIFSLRVQGSDKHFGNPYSSDKSFVEKDNLVLTESTKQSVEKYIDWVLNSEDKRAIWIREQLNSGVLKGKAIVYSKELDQPSHANALDYLINNWEGLRNQSVEANKTVLPKTMNEITNHSGGAIGADSMFDTIGREFGVLNHNHYWANQKTPKGNVELTKEQLEEGIEHAKLAAQQLGRPFVDKYANLLGRNWFQVKNSTQVIAIAPIVYPNEKNSQGYVVKAKRATVDGGTGYAVEMAIANGKEVNVFDTKTNQWYKWNGSTFVKSEIPILHKDFAGIGSRQESGKMTEQSIQAIRNVYEKTRDSLQVKPIEKSPTEIANEIKANQKSVVEMFENENFEETDYEKIIKINIEDLENIANDIVSNPSKYNIEIEEFLYDTSREFGAMGTYSNGKITFTNNIGNKNEIIVHEYIHRLLDNILTDKDRVYTSKFYQSVLSLYNSLSKQAASLNNKEINRFLYGITNNVVNQGKAYDEPVEAIEPEELFTYGLSNKDVNKFLKENNYFEKMISILQGVNTQNSSKIVATDKYLESISLTREMWNNLSEEEQKEVKKCN